MPSSCGHSLRILNGRSSAPAESVLRGGEGREGGKKRQRERIEKDWISLDGRHGNWIFSTP